METALIKNEYTGPVKKPLKITGGQFSLDFAYSQSATEVDAGIRETIRGVKLSIMAMGVALYRVDVSGLFIDLGFKKFGEYIDNLAEDTGEAYVKHRSELDKIGFTDDDGSAKLPYLNRAFEHYKKHDVFKNIKIMSKREFEEGSRGAPPKKKRYKSLKIKVSQIFAGNSPLVSFANGISPGGRRYYESLLLEGAKAVEKSEYAKVYRFYDEAEARRFDRLYQRELKALRAKK